MAITGTLSGPAKGPEFKGTLLTACISKILTQHKLINKASTETNVSKSKHSIKAKYSFMLRIPHFIKKPVITTANKFLR